MKRLRIDFAAPGLARELQRAGPGTWLLVALAAFLCASAATLGWRLLEQQRRFAVELNDAQLRANVPRVVAVAAPLPHISEQQAGAVNDAVMQLNLPWRALHDVIADATPASIALLALEPDARKQTLKITAEAKNPDDMVAYVAALGQQELFANVGLTRHEISEQDPNRPLRFQVEAQWKAP